MEEAAQQIVKVLGRVESAKGLPVEQTRLVSATFVETVRYEVVVRVPVDVGLDGLETDEFEEVASNVGWDEAFSAVLSRDMTGLDELPVPDGAEVVDLDA